jgi:hypothetical protein
VNRKTFKTTFSLLSLPVVLLINAIAVVEPTLAQTTLLKQETIKAQVFPNWSRVNVDQLISVMLPGNWKYGKNQIESEFNGTYYWATQERFETDDSPFNSVNVCDLINCKNLMKLMAQELTKEGDFVLKDVRSISVNFKGHRIDVMEFYGNYSSKPVQMKGRMFIVGNKMYLLAAGTKKNSYFDNNVNIFLESFINN